MAHGDNPNYDDIHPGAAIGGGTGTGGGPNGPVPLPGDRDGDDLAGNNVPLEDDEDGNDTDEQDFNDNELDPLNEKGKSKYPERK